MKRFIAFVLLAACVSLIQAQSAHGKKNFSWKSFDKPYFVFIHDDTNDYTGMYADLFIKNQVPMSEAAIPSRLIQYPERQEILRRLVEYGGEVLAHYDASPTEKSSDNEWLACTRDIKKQLRAMGFKARGIIRANSTQPRTQKGEKYCRKYFEYANDRMGLSMQYNIPRRLMLGFDSFDSFMEQIRQDVHVNGIHAYGFHGGRKDERWITEENLQLMIDYIRSQGNCEFTTYAHLFDTFGEMK